MTRTPNYDADSKGDIVIITEHAHIHRGKAFTCSQSLTIGNNVTMDAIIFVPTSVFPHLRVWKFETDAAPFDTTLYEGPFTIENSGEICTPINLNRASSNVTSVAYSVVASVTLNNSLSTELEYHRVVGAKQTGGSVGEARIEFDLNHNTNYLLRFTNVGAGASPGGLFLFWYE